MQTAPEAVQRSQAGEPPALPLAAPVPPAVQRQVEEEEEEEEEKPIQTAAEAVQRAPADEPPALPLAAPAVQRHAQAEEEPVQAAPETAPAVQTAPERAQPFRRTQLPLNRGPGIGKRDTPSRSMPVQRTAILPQARHTEQEERPERGSAEPLPVPGVTRTGLRTARRTDQGAVAVRSPQAIRSDLPLPPVITVQRVQRQATAQVTGAVSAGAPPTEVVQRAAMMMRAEAATEQSSAPQEQDLEKLAQQIYPLIRRRLAIERERRIGRW